MGFTTRTLASWVLVFAVVDQVSVSGSVLAPAGDIEKKAPELYPLSLELAWYDADHLLPHSFETMSGEVRRIFSEFGITVRWGKGREDVVKSLDVNPLRINVVLLPSSSASWGLQKAVMGVATHRKGIKGSAYVFFPDLLRGLSIDEHPSELETLRGMRNLGLAMGRVVAHEVVHVLAPYHPHTSDGLMKSQLTRRFLTRKRSRVHLDDATAHVLRAEIRAKAGPALKASGVDGIQVITGAEEPVAGSGAAHLDPRV